MARKRPMHEVNEAKGFTGSVVSDGSNYGIDMVLTPPDPEAPATPDPAPSSAEYTPLYIEGVEGDLVLPFSQAANFEIDVVGNTLFTDPEYALGRGGNIAVKNPDMFDVFFADCWFGVEGGWRPDMDHPSYLISYYVTSMDRVVASFIDLTDGDSSA